MQQPKVSVATLPHAEGLALPRYQTRNAAGMDLLAAVAKDAPVTLAPGEQRLIPTGLRMAIPPGFEGQVRSRSGLALKSGIIVLNSPGTIDADYRGEVQVILANVTRESFTVRRGDRIAQLVFVAVAQAELCKVDVLDDTERGEGGFGSTGVTAAP